MPHRALPGPDRRSAGPACTHQALRVPAHTHAAPTPEWKPAARGSWFCFREQTPSKLISKLSLTHTHTHSHNHSQPPSRFTGWTLPALSQLLGLSPFQVPFLCFCSFSSWPSFVHSFTHPVTNAVQGPALRQALGQVRGWNVSRTRRSACPQGALHLQERDTEQTKAETRHSKSTERQEGNTKTQGEGALRS